MLRTTAYSSTVRSWIRIGDSQFELGKIGPTYCVLRKPIQLEANTGTIVVEVDGSQRQSIVRNLSISNEDPCRLVFELCR
ncbi:MAG: hypothetical protein ACK5OC_19065 [Pirellula sp.]|jgi:hypothetical protein|nr:hypothetical protein [Planctomycetota bacterium]